MIRKFILLLIYSNLFVGSSIISAQILTPVHWSYAAKKLSATEAVVFVKATIDDGWHIYSQSIDDGIAVKTSFKFKPSKTYKLSGKTIEPAPVKHKEKASGREVSYFEKSVIFQQKVKLTDKGKVIVVKGTIEFMTCNDQKCLPPDDLEFSVEIK